MNTVTALPSPLSPLPSVEGSGEGVIVSFITEPRAIDRILDHLRLSLPVRHVSLSPLEFLWDSHIFPIEILLESQ